MSGLLVNRSSTSKRDSQTLLLDAQLVAKTKRLRCHLDQDKTTQSCVVNVAKTILCLSLPRETSQFCVETVSSPLAVDNIDVSETGEYKRPPMPIGGFLLRRVDPRGIEPLISRCHRDVLPLYHGPSGPWENRTPAFPMRSGCTTIMLMAHFTNFTPNI